MVTGRVLKTPAIQPTDTRCYHAETGSTRAPNRRETLKSSVTLLRPMSRNASTYFPNHLTRTDPKYRAQWSDYELDGRNYIPGRGRDYSLRYHAHTDSGNQQACLSFDTGSSFPAAKRPERESDHSHTFTVKVTKCGAITLLHQTTLWQLYTFHPY
jgi:hypothetical protein